MKKIVILCTVLLGSELGWGESFTSLLETAIPDGNVASNIAGEVVDILDTRKKFGRGTAITNVSLEVLLTHPRVGDLTIELTSPSGTELQVLARPGDSHADETCGNPAGYAGNVSSNFPLLFMDSALPSAETMGSGLGDNDTIGDGSPDTYLPGADGWGTDISGFAHFIGEDPSEKWTIRIGDYNDGNTGMVHACTLTIQAVANYSTCVAP